jgi:hypothetical protein
VIPALVALGVFLLLVLFAANRLRKDYPAGTAVFILLLLIVQLMTLFSAAVLPALVLAFLLTVIARSARVLAEAQSARGVVILGVALAGTQLATPAGAAIAAILAPVLALHEPARKRARNAGLLLLLLFIPIATAFLLAYLAREAAFDPAAYFSTPFDFAIRPAVFARLNPRMKGFIEAALLGVLAIPVWLAALRSQKWTASAQVAFALGAAVAVSAVLGRASPLGISLPAIAMLNVMSFAEPQGDPLPPVHAVAFSVLSTVASWLFIVLPA